MNIKWGLISIASLFLVFIYQAGLSCAQHDEPPVIDGIQISNSWVSVSTMNDLTCEAYDPENENLSYSWSASGGTISGIGKQASWNAPDEPGLYYISVSVNDVGGNEATGQVYVGVTGDALPVIYGLVADPSAVGAGTHGTLKCWAVDPEGGTLNYAWEVSCGTLNGSGSEVSWLAPEEAAQCVVKVRVTDPNGGAADMTMNINVLPNHAPRIDIVEAVPSPAHPGDEVVIHCAAIDVDGDTLTYNWDVSGGTYESNGPLLTWTAPEDCGYYYCTVSVDDGRAGSDMKEIQLRVTQTSGG